MTYETYKHISARDLINEICSTFTDISDNTASDLLEYYCDTFGDFDTMTFCYRPEYRIQTMGYVPSYFDKYIKYIFETYFPDDKVLVIEW